MIMAYLVALVTVIIMACPVLIMMWIDRKLNKELEKKYGKVRLSTMLPPAPKRIIRAWDIYRTGKEISVIVTLK